MTSRPPTVTVAIPALDEERYIVDCLASLVGQWPADSYEIVVADGGSSDRTVELVEAFAAAHPAPAHPQVRVVHNPARIQAAGVNLVARQSQADVLVRADAHGSYASAFVAQIVADLLRTGATSVVVPMRTQAQPGERLQAAIARAQSSRLGNGGSAHRVGGQEGFVEHGHHAAFDLPFFRQVGGYDERFVTNQDAELDHRARRAGGRIWMSREPVTYYPRRTLRALARQYARHGAGRARTLRTHGLAPRPRQLAPVAVLAGEVGALALAPLAPRLATAGLAYPLSCLAWGLGHGIAARDVRQATAGPALMVMHLAWAAGFVGSWVQGPMPGTPRLGAAPAQAPPDLVAQPR